MSDWPSSVAKARYGDAQALAGAAAYLVGGIGLLLMLQHGADILTHVKVGP